MTILHIHCHITCMCVYVCMCAYSTHPEISVCWTTDHCCTIKLGAPDSSCVTCERTQVLCKELSILFSDTTCRANSAFCILVNKHGTCVCPNTVYASKGSHLSSDGVPHSECVVIWSTHNSTARELQTCYLHTWEDRNCHCGGLVSNTNKEPRMLPHDVTVLLCLLCLYTTWSSCPLSIFSLWGGVISRCLQLYSIRCFVRYICNKR